MPVIIQVHSFRSSPDSSSSSSANTEACSSTWSQTTTPSSLSSASPRIPSKVVLSQPTPSTRPPPYRAQSRFQPSGEARANDLPPSTVCCHRASVDSYVSKSASEETLDDELLPDGTLDLSDDGESDSEDVDDNELSQDRRHRRLQQQSGYANNVFIPRLPDYRPSYVDRHARPTSPQRFAELFPSLKGMTVCHDENTLDGNMNLRVDMSMPTDWDRPAPIYQLFHLRMYDLAKREFSLRRYARDSGREVCNSKLLFVDPSQKKHRKGFISLTSTKHNNIAHWDRTNSTAGSDTAGDMTDAHPTLQRSMTSALRSLGAMAAPFRRSPISSTRGSSSSHQPNLRPATSCPTTSAHDGNAHAYYRPYLSSSTPSLFSRDKRNASSPPLPPPPRPRPTNTIKLEFGNYGRVTLERRGGSSSSVGHDQHERYEFEWWEHKYVWKRHTEKVLNRVSYHLMRDGSGDNAIAHIVPEMRTPSKIEADEIAGGWIPPCQMWISDPCVLTAQTDVADVIVSTGLIALVDDCIRMRWQLPSKAHGLNMPLMENVPRALMQRVFHRRNSGSSGNSNNSNNYISSLLRHG